MREFTKRLPDGREVCTLPCGHEVVDNGGLEIVCTTCKKIYQRVGLHLEAPEAWRLPESKTKKVIL